MTVLCLRCRREFIRTGSTAPPGRARTGKPSPYCTPCRAHRKQTYDNTRRAEKRAAAGPPKTRKAVVTPMMGLRPRPCRCAVPAPKTEGPLLVCGICARELETADA